MTEETKPASDELVDHVKLYGFRCSCAQYTHFRSCPIYFGMRFVDRIDRDRALLDEARKMLGAMIDSAVTDSDSCSICLHGAPGHIDGCTMVSAEALLTKLENR